MNDEVNKAQGTAGPDGIGISDFSPGGFAVDENAPTARGQAPEGF